MKLFKGETKRQAVERIILGLLTFGIIGFGLFAIGFVYGYLSHIKDTDPDTLKAMAEQLTRTFTNLAAKP